MAQFPKIGFDENIIALILAAQVGGDGYGCARDAQLQGIITILYNFRALFLMLWNLIQDAPEI